LTLLATSAALSVAGCSKQSTAAAAEPAVGAPPAAAPRPAGAASVRTATTTPLVRESSVGETTVVVQRATLREYVPAVGVLRARQVTRIASQVSGRVAAVRADVGDVVAIGKVLVELDPNLIDLERQQKEAAVAAARGTLASAAADVGLWQRELNRQRELGDRGAGSQKETDDAQSAYDRAAATRDAAAGKLLQAQHELEYAEQRLHELAIAAPFDGVVTARFVDVGDMASSQPVTELLEIQEVGTLYLEFSLPQELLAAVTKGTAVEFTIEGVTATPRPAQVDVLYPAIDEATRSFRCRAFIANKDLMLRPGSLVGVRVVRRQVADVLVVPRAALEQGAAGWQVRVLDGDRTVLRPVQVGLLTDTAVEVQSGLTAGERVIVPQVARD
jgi:membrane fusion protein (multidrug efflux system)